jgi:SagB-type dehydrogenase family enzyme
MFLFELYEFLLKKKKTDVRPFEAVQSWPEEWKTITSKRYERFPCVTLPLPHDLEYKLTSAIKNRVTTRTFTSRLTREMLGTLLWYTCGERKPPEGTDHDAHRTYPSAGMRYPLECYVLLMKDVETLPRGVYHYDVGAHGLRPIGTKVPEVAVMKEATAESFVENATGALFFTWTRARSAPKYKERAYKLMLIELGAATQNASLISTALGISLVHVGTCADDVVLPLLDIDGEHEAHVHTLFWG